MPPTATLEDIKAYQDKVEKDKITPHNLPPCPRCRVDSCFFKIHAYRERRFLIIIEMLIQAAYCSLVRFKCPGCEKTFTNYPDFAIPHKHYTQPTIMGFAGTYLQDENMTYQKALMSHGAVPGYPQNDASLAPSTLHRWITTLSRLTQTCRTALIVLLQKNPVSGICRSLAQIVIPQRKFQTKRRKKQLVGCRQLMIIEAFFHDSFKTSIFTKLATRHGFG
jgi:hypothetical protein